MSSLNKTRQFQLLSLRNQMGGALIIFFLVLVLAGSSFLISVLTDRSINDERDKETTEALAEAKAALIGYALTYDDVHPGEVFGYLPCPDTSATDPNGEGSQSPCGNLGVSVLGRLPWKTLKIPPLKDGYGECLWYAISGSYKNNPKTTGMSPSTLGLLELLAADGSSYLAGPTDPAVAIIFSPGAPLSGQNRVGDGYTLHCGGNYSANNYLDIDIASGMNNAEVSSDALVESTLIAATDSRFTSSDEDHFNDKLLIIRRSEIFASYCKKYANTLISLITGSTNGCDISGTPSNVCIQASDNLLNYCTPQSCNDAAQVFISSPCLSDLNDVACQTSIADLKECHG